MHESEGRVLVEVFEKLTSAWFIQTARENMHYVGKNCSELHNSNATRTLRTHLRRWKVLVLLFE